MVNMTKSIKKTSIPSIKAAPSDKKAVTVLRSNLYTEYCNYICSVKYIPSLREFAEIKGVTPSAILQHFRVLHSAGYFNVLYVGKSAVCYIPVNIQIKIPLTKVVVKK